MVDDDVPLNTNSSSPGDWSMVVIRDDNDRSVFPPINHENLQHQRQSSSPSSCFPPLPSASDSEPSSSTFDSQVRKGGDFVEWLSIGLQILRSRYFAAVSSFRKRVSRGGAVSSFGVRAAAVAMSCWIVMRIWCWFRFRFRKRKMTPSEALLVNIIKEKDERISQLLHQIAQMNEILIARHKDLAAKLVE